MLGFEVRSSVSGDACLMAKTDTTPLRAAGERLAIISTAGMQNASVFPVPVRAFAKTSIPITAARVWVRVRVRAFAKISTPVSAGGIDCCCTTVILSYFSTFVSAFLVAADTGSSANEAEVMADSVVVLVRASAWKLGFGFFSSCEISKSRSSSSRPLFLRFFLD